MFTIETKVIVVGISANVETTSESPTFSGDYQLQV